MKRAVLLVALTLSLSVIVGCYSMLVDHAAQAQNEREPSSVELPSFEIGPTQKPIREGSVFQYDVGSGEYTAQSGKKMPYRLRGVLGVPEGEGTFPLAIIIHGSHDNEDETRRFDTGFTYLVEALVGRGYIAAALDCSSAYQWKYGDGDDREKILFLAGEHIEKLKASNEGRAMGFSADLKGKIDFSSTAYIGHSRGGDTVFDLALSQCERGVAAKAILSIAPSAPSNLEAKCFPDVMTSLLVPEFDGDVVSLDGFAVFTALEKAVTQPIAVTLLKQANHNYFNTNVEANDALLARTETELKDQLTAEKQQFFLQNFVADFLDAAMMAEGEGSLYDPATQSPNRMYGMDVATRSSAKKLVYRAGQEKPDALTFENCAVEPVTDSWFFEKDEVKIDSLTFGAGAHQTKSLLNVRWEEVGKLALRPENQDLSEYASLIINLAIDPVDLLNETDEYQRFSMTMRDQSGYLASVILPEGQNALKKTEGELDFTPIFDEEYEFWSHPTPICSIQIPLSAFVGIDLTAMEELTLQFDQTGKGAIYLESIGLR